MLHAHVASFTYRQEHFSLEIVGVDPLTFATVCPICGTKCRIGTAHELIVNVKAGTFSVTPSLVCPNRECRWQVLVFEGIAVDSGKQPIRGEPQPPEQPEVQYCTDCWAAFKPGAAKQTRCRRCKPVDHRPKSGRVGIAFSRR